MVWLTNPGFETGLLTPWTYTTNTAGGAAEIGAAYANGSDYGCWVYHTDSTSGKYAAIDQLIELPSVATTLEFDFKRLVNDGTVKVSVEVLYIVTWYEVWSSTGATGSSFTHVIISKDTIESITGGLIQNIGAITVKVTRV